MIFLNHLRVIIVVADVLAPIRRQDICNHHDDVDLPGVLQLMKLHPSIARHIHNLQDLNMVILDPADGLAPLGMITRLSMFSSNHYIIILLLHVYVMYHDDVIKWKHFTRYWTFVRGIHWSPVNSLHKVQWRRALMFSLICILNKLLSKQSWGWWFETPLCSLWHHCNLIMFVVFVMEKWENKLLLSLLLSSLLSSLYHYY